MWSCAETQNWRETSVLQKDIQHFKGKNMKEEFLVDNLKSSFEDSQTVKKKSFPTACVFFAQTPWSVMF